MFNSELHNNHNPTKDHLGSIRVVTDQAMNIEQVNNYTPFGVSMYTPFAQTVNQRYKYNGKELERVNGLDMYDYGARLYDPPLATWHNMDELCEKHPELSPFVYCDNDPVNKIDPDGRDDYRLNRDGTLTLATRTKDNNDRLLAGKQSIFVGKNITKQLLQERDDYDGSYAVGTKNMDKLFKFVADNTDVEWSIASIETKNGHKDILSTSHDETFVKVRDYNGDLPGGYSVLDMTSQTHSHTDEHTDPSGFSPSDYYINKKGDIIIMGASDRMAAYNFTKEFETSKRTVPSFYMYHVPSGKGVRYDVYKIYNPIK